MKNIFKLLLLIVGAAIVVIIGHIPLYTPDSRPVILNVLQGAYASSLVVILFELIAEIRLYKRLKFLDGQWQEFEIKDRFLSRPIANGRITYSGGNSLTIQLSHDDRMWGGEIIVNKIHPHIGTISWSYIPDKGGEHEFGLKELIIPTERNKADQQFDYLYLVPVNYGMGSIGELRADNRIVLTDYGYSQVVWRKHK